MAMWSCELFRKLYPVSCR